MGRGKYFHFTMLSKMVIKIFINLVILAGFCGLARYGYLLFSQKVDALMGSIIFIAGIIVWVLVIKLLFKRYRRAKPSFKAVVFSVVAILLVFTLVGLEPLNSYKKNVFTIVTTMVEEWQVENRATKEVAKSDVSSDPTNPIDEVEATRGEDIKDVDEANFDEIDWAVLKTVEMEVVIIVNMIREDRGTQELIWDEELYGYSKRHSEDMASKGELYHTPVGKPYGENCWGGAIGEFDALDIVNGWMTSPPHRTWLLNPHLKHIAVGIAISSYGAYASWTFWINEAHESDWWYCNGGEPPEWWY